MCILQDDKGFMWFGTQDGLNRFDGYNIKVFKNIPNDSTSLAVNFVSSLFEDQSGNLIVETERNYFQRYNPLTQTFTTLRTDKSKLRYSRFNSIYAFLKDSSGTEWIGGQGWNTGLKRIDKKTGKVTLFEHDPSNPYSLSDDRVNSVYRDRSGNLWVGTKNGLDKLDEKTGKFTHFKNKKGDPNSISDNWIWPIYEDSQGNLWIGTHNGGLNKFNPKTGEFSHFISDPLDPNSINDNNIVSIYQDRSGVIWIGTISGGVNYCLPSAQVFNLYQAKSNDKNWFSDNYIQSLYADKNGFFWIGTRSSGLYKFDHKKNQFTNYSHNPSSSNSVSSDAIMSIFMDKTRNLWIGNYNTGLDEYNPENNTFKHYKNNPSDPNSISDNRIFSIIQGKDNNIWIGTYGGGLNKLDPKTGKITRFQNRKNDLNSISSNRVWSIAEDKTGKLWLGTFGGGLNIFDSVNNIVTVLNNDPNDTASLMDDNIIDVFIDSRDNVWVGSTKGLSEYNVKDKIFKNYTERDGLPNEIVFGILEDNKGNLWISTNFGLSRFNPSTKVFKNYFVQDGLQGNEFNQNAFAKNKLTGMLAFGGPNGFNVVNLEKVNNFIPPVVITKIEYNTEENGGKQIIEDGISEGDTLRLTYKDNLIKFQFAALNYYNTSANQYKYKLEGLSSNWIQLENNNSVIFSNLSPGEYNFRIAGSNNDGIWNDKGASLFIEVTPPWWKTKIAYIIYVILFLGVLYLIRRFELNRREQKTKIRENELHLKATEAEKRAIQAENDRKTKELEEARELQLSMLPKDLPDLPNLEVAAFMRTSTEVGGDYYDFIVHDGGLLNVAFGDATGHGLRAGTMVTLIKAFFTSYAANHDLVDFMNNCNAMLKEVNLGKLLMSFSLLKINDHKLEITSAGMPPLYYFDGKTREIEEIIIPGIPLGAMKRCSYKKVEKDLNSGDILLLMTDGLPEQMNDKEEMFDYPQVNRQFRNIVNDKPEPKDIIEKFVNLADNWMGEVAQADDITLVAIKIK